MGIDPPFFGMVNKPKRISINQRPVTIPSDSNWTIWLWTDGIIGFGTIADYDAVQLLQTRENRIIRYYTEHSLDYPTPGNYVIDLTNHDKPVLIEQ
jgi:hypothetical protein